MITIKATVTGKVQGVWFRGSCREVALPLGINGYAKNLSDGSVEVLAQGSEHHIESLCDWLNQGPSNAVVTSVEVEYLDNDVPSGFSVL